jgi:hypothetical protein
MVLSLNGSLNGVIRLGYDYKYHQRAENIKSGGEDFPPVGWVDW